MADRWGLSAYPLSAEYRARLDRQFGDSLRSVVLAEMPHASPWSLVATLRRVRAPEGYVLLEDGGSNPLVPVLKFLLSLTRCTRLAVIDASLRPSPFTRLAGLLEAGALMWGTIAGVWSAVLCFVELQALQRVSGPPNRGSVSLHRAAFLRTNLWFGLKAGGSVGHVAGIVNSLARRSERVDVLSPDVPPMLSEKAAVVIIPAAQRHGYPYELNYYAYHRRFVRRARAVLAGTKPGFLYHRLSLGSYAGVSLARSLGIPLVLEYNGSEVWVSEHWGSRLRFPRLARLAEDVPLRLADVITTVSDVLGDELRARGVADERIVVHPNGVDPATFDPARFSSDERIALRARYGLRAEDVVCTFVGTFGRWHGVALLAEAIRELVATDEAWLRAHRVRFLLVGDGLCMSQVRQTIEGAAARYVTLTGLVPQQTAAAYLAASDVLLSPHVPNPDGSRFFGSPTKLFEYMAMAKAIVASDLEQIGQVLCPAARAAELPQMPDPGAVAILTTPGNAGELIAGIRFLSERPAVRDRLGVNARARVLAHYTWDHNVAALVSRVRTLYGAA